ncbi:MAG: [FeFe] hydrogenase H-cluster radical SAM maturase HydG [Candidatus Omnitrophota bacterium]|nr:MAG: [FeFe] hydrogenase H-cluster radical SAM maturase HydG [Candidatus Omnitrophota bacterium]
MCYSIPGLVKEISGKTVTVDYFGEEKKALNEFYDIAVGDYVNAAAGFVIKKIPASEAENTLQAWRELFFELQDIDTRLSRLYLEKKDTDKNLTYILDKALATLPLKDDDLLYLANLTNASAHQMLFKTANFLRQKYHKNSCCVHGIIEISNYCCRHCSYCGISSHNRNIRRYRMTSDEIIKTCIEAVEKYKFQALVLQSGEDLFYSVNQLADIIKKIKERLPVLICISFGEVGLEGLEKLYAAGARGLLMRFETSNPYLYEKLHPGQTLRTRINHIKKAYELGFLVMTGGLIGIPGQTPKDIIDDIYLAKELHAEMYSFGPFLPHPDTPLANHKPPKEEEILKTLALIRIIDPENAKILVTTAFQTLSASARKKGLLAGANSVMLNVTPLNYRKHYSIYPEKAYTTEPVITQINETLSLLKSLGRAPTDLGISQPITANTKKISSANSNNGLDFINEDLINSALLSHRKPDPKKIRDILQKSLAIQTLTLDETAALLGVTDKKLREEMEQTAVAVKKKVYDNRIVTFAPLYTSNLCINNCLYCGFRKDNAAIKRNVLGLDEIKQETEVLAGKIGHKRLIVVYGEHPRTGIEYMTSTIKTIYEVKTKTNRGYGQIRRVNVNAPPLSVENLKILSKTGIGTYQVFQETYHHKTYKALHPENTPKSDYQWRLYCMHRALEAGVDDVGIGVLFGLYDWKFEVLALLCHTQELEQKFKIGPHTISFPRLEPAANTPFIQKARYKVSDADFEKLVTVLRLAVPYAGMILTARENAGIRKKIIPLGCTQTDASTRIGIGSYSNGLNKQDGNKQQFFLGDTRSLDELIYELIQAGYITSFCTAGYRCGRTGECIMELLREGKERKFCKINAVLTFREWLDDFGSPRTRGRGEEIIKKELNEIKSSFSSIYPQVTEYYERIRRGERDLYF